MSAKAVVVSTGTRSDGTGCTSANRNANASSGGSSGSGGGGSGSNSSTPEAAESQPKKKKKLSAGAQAQRKKQDRKWKAETKAKLIGCAQVLNWIHVQPVLEGGYFSQLRELLQPFACTPHIYQLGKASNSQGAAKQVPLSANCIIGICKDDNTPNEMTLHIVAAETRKR